MRFYVILFNNYCFYENIASDIARAIEMYRNFDK